MKQIYPLFKFKNIFTFFITIWFFSIPFKDATYQISTIILIILFIYHAIKYSNLDFWKSFWTFYKYILLLFLCLAGILIISEFSSPFGHDQIHHIVSFIYRYPLILIIFLYFYHQDIIDHRTIIKIIFITLFVHALNGIYQSFTSYDFFKHRPILDGSKLTGVTHQHNLFGMLMSFGAITSLIILNHFYFIKNNKTKSLFFMFTLLLFIFNLFHSQSRSSWIMFGIFFSGYIFFRIRKDGISPKITIIILLSLFAVLSIFLSDENLMHRFELLLQGNSSGRTTLIWPYVIDKIKSSFVIGYGIENFKEVMANTPAKFAFSPHNVFMQIFFTMGIFGILCYIGIIGISLYETIHTKCHFCTLLLVSYLILLQFDGSLIEGKVYTTAFIIILFFIFSYRKEIIKTSILSF